MSLDAVAALKDLLATLEHTNGDGGDEEDRGAISGAMFLLDQDASLTPRWGTDSEVLWAKGESLVIVGPPGVGKSTLAHQVITGLIGITDTVIGYSVAQAERVLYLALDRPSQIRRAMRRSLGECHRDVLEKRLVVWPRPLPGDLGKHPEILLQLAQRFECEVVVIDSIKDAVTKLTGDEEANNFNRAVQHCLAEGVDVLALHHQRKGQGGAKPTTLEDVYGSIWLVAGAGSVILLWGEAGSELIELTHLKQPADPVGPIHLEHDHHIASTTVASSWDALAFLRMKAANGSTLMDAAQAEHATTVVSDAKKKKTERKLRSLVRAGLARWEPQQQASDGSFGMARWFIDDVFVEVVEPWTNTVDTALSGMTTDGSHDASWTPADTNGKSAGHIADATVDTDFTAPAVDNTRPPLGGVVVSAEPPEPDDQGLF